MSSEQYQIGERLVIETQDGKKYRLPVSDVHGDRIWLDDGKTRLQVNVVTGVILVLNQPK